MFEILKKYPKLTLILVTLLVCVGLFGAGFYSGRRTAPVKIQEKIVEKEVVHTVVATKESDKKNEDDKEDKHVHTVVVVVKKPDGTTTTKTTTDVNDAKENVKTEIKYVDKVVTQTVTKEVTVTKTVETAKPNWLVSARLGTDFSHIKPQLTAPFFDPLLVGAEVDRRIIGPFYLGIWANSSTKLDYISAGVGVVGQF